MSQKIKARDALVGQFVRVVATVPPVGYYPGTSPTKPSSIGVASLRSSYGGARFIRTGGQQGDYTLTSDTTTLEVLEGEELEKAQETFAGMPVEPMHGSLPMGSDPEVFCLDKGGVVIPAWAYLPEKKKGLTFDPAGPSSRIFWDGFQAEFTTHAPYCHAQLVNSWQKGLKATLREAQKWDKGATLTHQCVVDIPLGMMMGASEEHTQLGCAPSYNAYGTPSVLDGVEGKMLPFRFAGCHIHFGTGKCTMETYISLVKALDAICGVFMVHLLEGLEDDRRRKFYGLAGEYRTPDHGLEWRTPSSAVLAHPIISNIVLDIARVALQMGVAGSKKSWDASEAEVQDCINSLDVPRARQILHRNNAVMQKVLVASYGGGVARRSAQMLLEKPAKELLDLSSMEKSWQFNRSDIYGGFARDCFLMNWRAAGYRD